MPTILITGGTGLVGMALSQFLIDQGCDLVILSRHAVARNSWPKGRVIYRRWSVEAQAIDPLAISEADFIVHLAGAGVADKRWTRSRKREIVESRTGSTDLIGKSLRDIPNRIKAVISASAIGWYGEDNQKHQARPFVETDPPANDFLGEACRRWEQSVYSMADSGKRLVTLRTGIVLSREGGALTQFERPVRMGIAATLGSGNQMVSWIHIADLCRIFWEAINNTQMHGPYNAVAPAPVSNKELTAELVSKMGYRLRIPLHLPVWALKLILGEMSIEVLKSVTVSAAKIQATGFQFLYPTLDRALDQLISSSHKP